MLAWRAKLTCVWEFAEGEAKHIVQLLMDISAPKKNILSPPPPQFTADTLPASRPLPPFLETPPPPFWDFQLKNHPPPTSWRLGLPLPPPRAEKNKNIRNVHQEFFGEGGGGKCTIKCPLQNYFTASENWIRLVCVRSSKEKDRA